MPLVKRSFFSTFERPFEFEQTREVACNFCSSQFYHLLMQESGFDIRRCDECGLVYVSPQPAAEEFAQLSENMYPDADESEVKSRSLGLHEKFIREIIKNRKPEGGRLLDVGCGYGKLLINMSDLPWDLTGIELSTTALSYAKEKLPDAAFHQTSIEQAPIENAGQDCITCIAVLEHVSDPRDVLQRFYDWLAPGGLLVIQVPYVVPFLRAKRFIPAIPIYFEAPSHLYDFPPKLLADHLRSLGFQDVRAEIPPPYSSPSRAVTALIWSVKLAGRAIRFLSGGKYIYPFVGSYTLHAVKTGR